jgi:excisionase family DNA binding protein
MTIDLSNNRPAPYPGLTPLMTLEEVCEWLQIDNQTIRRLARIGQIPGLKIGKAWRFNREELAKWVAGTARPGPA